MPGTPTSITIIALTALTLTLAGVSQSAGLFRQNLLFTRAQTEVSFWGRDDYQPDETTINRSVKQLNGLLRANPAHPDYLALQAKVFVWLAYWQSQNSSRVSEHAASENYSQRAISSQYAALLPRPAHRFSWQQLAEYVSRGEATPANTALAARAEQKINRLAVSAAR